MCYSNTSLIARALHMAVASTETMNSQDIDPDIIKARLRLIREIADGLGVDIKIPSNRVVMIKRLLSKDI